MRPSLLGFALASALAFTSSASAQEVSIEDVNMQAPANVPAAAPVAPPAPEMVTVPAGTRILLQLTNAISTRNARPGDGLYLQTNFPVVADGRVVVPAGTYVQGVIDQVKRAGRIKGRAEVRMHFTRLIYPNGYLVEMPGSLTARTTMTRRR